MAPNLGSHLKMSISRRWTAWFFLIVVALFGAGRPLAADAQTPRVTAVRTADQLGLTIAIDLDRRVDPRVFLLDEPMRLVLDLGAARWSLSQSAPARGAIAGWRFGRGDGQTRLVVDLSTPSQVRRIGYDLSAPRGVARLLVELEPTSRTGFAGGVQTWRATSDLLASVYTPPEATPPPAVAVAPPRPPSTVATGAPSVPAVNPPPITPPTLPSANPPTPPPVVQPPVVQPPVAAAPALPQPAAPPAPISPSAAVPPPATGAPASVPASPPQATPPVEPPAVATAAGGARPAGRIGAPGRAASRPVVVIDPGHGGQDPGAIGASGTYEKTITLAVSRDVKRRLEASGRYRVHLTRDRDEFLRLRERVQRARGWKADLFISIHADSIGSSETRGASLYTLSDTASDSEAAALATRENRADIIAGVDLSHESREVANILIDLAQRETMNRSATLASIMVRELGREVRMLAVSPHRFAGFAVLKAPDVPAVLLELGYLSNRQDEALLKQAEHRRKVAIGIHRAVDAFFARTPAAASP
ncbi:MAG: N-acetylmuramoyl-L-alanine amidase [Alphaproteobacteria bacterium]|nr:N-acetylmuramoyl-L-alanine amidase [Alphaproteobacteria bacterium]